MPRTQPTPGPWRLGANLNTVTAGMRCTIADCRSGSNHPAVEAMDAANARAIAALPALLEAAEALFEDEAISSFVEWQRRQKALRVAIAQVRDEEKEK